MPRLVLVAGCLLTLLGPLPATGVRADEASPNQAVVHSAEAPAGHAATGSEGGHAAAVDPKDKILDFSVELSVATAIVFILLWMLLYKFAWGPLKQALDAREKAQEDTVLKSEQARAEAERLLAEHRDLMARANEQVRGIMDDARRNAESVGNAIVAKAQTEADASRQRAERDIKQARDQALADIWSKTADVAVNVAGKVLSREIGPEEHDRLIRGALKDMQAVPTGERS